MHHLDRLQRMFVSLAWLGCAAAAQAADEPARVGDDDPLALVLAETVGPFLVEYCHDCHGADVREAKLDLRPYSTVESLSRFHQSWEEVAHRIADAEMPPPDAYQPTDDQRRTVATAIVEARRTLAARNAGDPGPVITRRLSHSEYNYTIRDLFGVDLRPADEFPVDPANEAGFDNTGESLTMSPSLMQKYLAAARGLAEHLVLKPGGFDFAPHPVATDTDRDKYAVRRIVDFYLRQPTDLADYFYAAWLLHVASDDPAKDDVGTNEQDKLADRLRRIAAQQQVSAGYLQRVWQMLQGTQPAHGPLADVHRRWHALPGQVDEQTAARRACEAIRDRVLAVRRRLEPTFPNLVLQGGHLGSQQFVLWKNDQYAAHRRKFVPGSIESIEPGSAEAKKFPGLLIPQDSNQLAEFNEALKLFCDLFPDAFYVSERGRDYVGKKKEDQEKGRLLSAGFHSMMGYYRDDKPLYEMILDDAGRAEIDRLWRELDFITAAPIRQYQGFVWFERTDSSYMRDEVFNFARAEDKSVTDEPMIRRLAKEYRAKAVRNEGSDEVLQAIDLYFERINRQIRQLEQAWRQSEPVHLERLLEFADRAYRRPLDEAERQGLLDFYHALRNDDGLSHEEAMQDAIVSILVSPWFFYRADLAPTDDVRRPLSDHELANRLSYFLWSSMPDSELRRLADSGQLTQPGVLVAQARRMLADDKGEALALEFAGNWLDFRRFDQHNSVDRQRFPEFTDSLRQAMFEEPLRFFIDLLRRDGSVLEFLQSDHTFVNAELAEHYGIDWAGGGEEIGDDQWRKVDVRRQQRGGLVPMAVFQTANATGLRTSPVRRGYWVARRLLGQRIPPPPPDVPELPEDEKELGPMTMAEALAKHRDHAACAGCHERFDSLGLALEQFDPVGRLRSEDLGGHAIDARAEFPGGVGGEGIEGLRAYLTAHRRDDFVDHLCRQLLSYGLGRNLILSDEPLVQQIQRQLKDDGYRTGSLVESIITSPQFLEKRGRTSP